MTDSMGVPTMSLFDVSRSGQRHTRQGNLGAMLFSPKGCHVREERRVSIDDINWSVEAPCACPVVRRRSLRIVGGRKSEPTIEP
jgi:hypothetical protein